MIKITVDNNEIETEENLSILQACLNNGIYIPNLCYMSDMKEPPGACRLCFVEVKGFSQPVPSCTVKVKEGMIVKTDTEQVKTLQRTAFELLLSVHSVDCKNCPAHGKCELQRIAKFLHFGLKLKKLDAIERDIKRDDSHPYLDYHPDKCVLCGKCVFVCQRENGRPLLAFAGRGLDTVISFFGSEEDAKNRCKNCSLCADICPVGAITKKRIVAA